MENPSKQANHDRLLNGIVVGNRDKRATKQRHAYPNVGIGAAMVDRTEPPVLGYGRLVVLNGKAAEVTLS
jgi:hypothetical protein